MIISFLKYLEAKTKQIFSIWKKSKLKRYPLELVSREETSGRMQIGAQFEMERKGVKAT